MIKHNPHAGMVLTCDFTGYKAPEMVKRRQVVVISPNHLNRPRLVTVVPLSTSKPETIEDYHYLLSGNPVPGDPATEVWAKCDMVAVVRYERLDRIKLGRGNYVTGSVSMDQVRAIRRGVARSLGIEFGD